jgi:hypothetical protein
MCILVVGLSFPVFSADAENESAFPPDFQFRMRIEYPFERVLALGFEYGNFFGRSFDGTRDVKTYRPSPAINFHSYSIRNGHSIGMFAHAFLFGFPDRGTVNGIKPEYTNYFGLQSGFIIGPLFRRIFNEKFTLLYGVGPSLLVTGEEYTQYAPLTDAEEIFEKITLNIGIGVNIMLKYTISSNLFLFAGCILTYDFLSFSDLESRPSNPALNVSGKAKDFSMLGVRPYVSLGFRL